LTYYTAPADLDERVQSVYAEIRGPVVHDRSLDTRYSGFSMDGSIRSYNAMNLLQAIQVGMLAEARLELNVYNLLLRLKKPVGRWLGGDFTPTKVPVGNVASLADATAAARTFSVFKEEEGKATWLDVVRSEFHEREISYGRERVVAKRELEFVVPNPLQSSDISTNGLALVPVLKDADTGKYLVGLQKISNNQSQFPAVQLRENYSGHITIPCLRLPSDIEHIQQVPAWIAKQVQVRESAVTKLGESYFPSLGVLPNRIFPFVITGQSDYLGGLCDYYWLEEVLGSIDKLHDAHTLIAIFRLAHALKQWPFS
jgi:hypothetical protein